MPVKMNKRDRQEQVTLVPIKHPVIFPRFSIRRGMYFPWCRLPVASLGVAFMANGGSADSDEAGAAVARLGSRQYMMMRVVMIGMRKLAMSAESFMLREVCFEILLVSCDERNGYMYVYDFEADFCSAGLRSFGFLVGLFLVGSSSYLYFSTQSTESPFPRMIGRYV